MDDGVPMNQSVPVIQRIEIMIGMAMETECIRHYGRVTEMGRVNRMVNRVQRMANRIAAGSGAGDGSAAYNAIAE